MKESSYQQAIAILLHEIEITDLRVLLRGIKFLQNEPAKILTNAIEKHIKENS